MSKIINICPYAAFQFELVILGMPLWMILFEFGYLLQFGSTIINDLEHYLYDYLPQRYDKSMPLYVHKLNENWGFSNQCDLCSELYNFNSDCILHCGHRFHHACLRRLELEQFDDSFYKSYECPICLRDYSWRKN